MTDKRKPQEILDKMLEDIQGGGVMTTPVGGWGVTVTDGPRGVWKAPAGTEANATETRRASQKIIQSGGDPKT